MTARPTLAQLAADLTAGRTTSRALVEEALSRIADPAGEGSRVFVKVYADAARVAAGVSSSALEPASVTSPATSKRSLIETGMPASGEAT